MDLRRERKGSNTIIGILLILIVLVVLVSLYILYTQSKAVETIAPVQLENMDARAAPVKKKIFSLPASKNAPTEFSYSIQQRIKLSDAADEAQLSIENPVKNLHLMVVEIVLEPQGEVIFRSGFIPPGYQITSATLDAPVSAGEYVATAIFYAIDTQSLDILGMLEQSIEIIMKK